MREELAFGRRADHTGEELLPRDQAQRNEDASLLQDVYVLREEPRAATVADETALDEYVLAWGRTDEDPQALTALLREEVLLKTYPRSVEQLAPLVADKQDPSALRLLARVCEAKNDYDRAIALLTDAIRMAPDDVAALSILARVYAKRDGEAAAVPWHERILEVNPKVRASRVFLARWYYAQGQYAAALPHWERLFLRERQNRVCELYWLLTTIHCYGIRGLEKRLAAVQSWQDLTAQERSLLHELFLLVGKHRLQEGELDLAEQALRFALRLMPAREGERLLAEVKQRKKEVGQQARQPSPLRTREQQNTADLDTFIASWALAVYEEDRRKRFTIAKRLGVIAVILLAGAGGLWSYRQFRPTWHSVAFWKSLPFLRLEERTGAAGKAVALPSAPAGISRGETGE
ncbi:MAG: tetratricopeptide repeat protein, partial [Candidatus Binatia bacterium]|nr:tetratricopeptide repeat protein [Candidatus Binatia bacterium]